MTSDSVVSSEELESSRLQLKACDEEGCDVVSSLLQDSILHVFSHSFHEDKKCLRLMLNRFCWELLRNRRNTEEYDDQFCQERRYFRVHSGLYIHNVESITVNSNFKKSVAERYLNLLAVHASKKEVNLLFSGHKNMCVKTSGLNIYLKDLHAKYPTLNLPEHECLN